MSSEELSKALNDALQDDGVNNRLESILRTELFKLMHNENAPPTPSTPENDTINELIKEYLEFNGFSNSLAVFESETGHNSVRLSRKQAAMNLNLNDQNYPSDLPLLYGITKLHQ